MRVCIMTMTVMLIMTMKSLQSMLLSYSNARGHVEAELFKKNSYMKDPSDVQARFCNEILETGEWPIDWLKSVFIQIPEISESEYWEEHRTITLIKHATKSILRVLMQKAQKTAEEQFPKVQIGFGTRD